MGRVAAIPVEVLGDHVGRPRPVAGVVKREEELEAPVVGGSKRQLHSGGIVGPVISHVESKRLDVGLLGECNVVLPVGDVESFGISDLDDSEPV